MDIRKNDSVALKTTPRQQIKQIVSRRKERLGDPHERKSTSQKPSRRVQIEDKEKSKPNQKKIAPPVELNEDRKTLKQDNKATPVSFDQDKTTVKQKKKTPSVNLDRARTTLKQKIKQRLNFDKEMKPRPPKCLIVGFSKCGTSALKGFLALHPDIVSPKKEIDFFTNYYFKGLEWYRRQMPPSLASQLTIEKTPEYILTPQVLRRIRDYNSNMKLLVMVRDPIVRLQSLYLHELIHKPQYSDSTTFRQWCGGGGRTAHVASVVDYASHIRDAFGVFSRKQVLVQSEEELEKFPIKVLRRIESFLGLRPVFTKDHLVYSKKKGFYCFNMSKSTFSKAYKSVEMNKNTGCFTASKGRPHQRIAPNLYRELVAFTRPYNRRLFELLGRTYAWENFR
ncbi:heparan sulfate glucosamine 3-O-sulfotransferase 3A1 [Elysia marginata]|uniref:Heparan sulfate glucosamine 3-O-sulfotransferase 3A1 n=1 Tax=Elysia marginata TaxID=1093978 RepID=A0AAV4IK63_9GAST|nr:heparan sulfate glucosamine 3-O-sulfotransferase 3A1 [Elysia marginata]